MTNAKQSPTVSTQGAETFQLRPKLMLMLLRVRATAATLELSLEDVKRQCIESTQRLTRLGAMQVEAGEPHEDERAEMDPTARIRATMRPRLPRLPDVSLPQRPGINVLLTARWNIEDMSAEDVLLLIDQLRFDSAAHVEPEKEAVVAPSWDTRSEGYLSLLTKMHDPPPIDLKPQFLFISRAEESQLSEATEKAYQRSKRIAERLAKAADKQLGDLMSLSIMGGSGEVRPDHYLSRQQVSLVLSVSSYDLQSDEYVSDDVRPTDVSVSVHATHALLDLSHQSPF